MTLISLFISPIVSGIIQLIVLLTCMYFFLKEDYDLWKKTRNLKGLTSENLVELKMKLKRNHGRARIEIFAIILFLPLLSFFVDFMEFGIVIPFSSLLFFAWLTFWVIYRAKAFLKRDINIYNSAKRDLL